MRTARYSLPSQRALALCAIPSAAVGPVAAARLAVPEGPRSTTAWRADRPGRAAGRPRAAHRAPGHVWLHDPATGLKTLAASSTCTQHDEEGLQSIALDPNFEQNGWIYLTTRRRWTRRSTTPRPPRSTRVTRPSSARRRTSPRSRAYIRLSRFQWDGRRTRSTSARSRRSSRSRSTAASAATSAATSCSTATATCYCRPGDDTNPFQSDGYTPIDERAGRNPAFDAQRTAANTNDLRGKILRITPTEGGGYSIPDGNLFADDNPLTRPEIYLMGLRNPFRIEYNSKRRGALRRRLLPGRQTRRTRCAGRPATASGSIATEPGNFGWPYCATAELPYVDYDFATGMSGAAFDCATRSTSRRTTPGSPICRR